MSSFWRIALYKCYYYYYYYYYQLGFKQITTKDTVLEWLQTEYCSDCRSGRRAGIPCWLERQTRNRMVASSNPGRSGGKNFFSGVNFVCWLLFGVRFTPVLPQWHVKDPGHSAKSAGGRLHLNTKTFLTQRSRSGLTMPPGIVWEPIWKPAHTQVVRKHSDTVVSAR